MVSAEYAVGILAAVAFAAVLLAVMKSSAVKTALTSIVTRSADHMKRGGQHGYITAKFALVLPAVVMVLTVALALIQVGVLRLTAVEAARAGAREAALGSGTAQVVAVARGGGRAGCAGGGCVRRRDQSGR